MFGERIGKKFASMLPARFSGKKAFLKPGLYALLLFQRKAPDPRMDIHQRVQNRHRLALCWPRPSPDPPPPPWLARWLLFFHDYNPPRLIAIKDHQPKRQKKKVPFSRFMEESRHKCICLTWELIKDERVTNKMPDKS